MGKWTERLAMIGKEVASRMTREQGIGREGRMGVGVRGLIAVKRDELETMEGSLGVFLKATGSDRYPERRLVIVKET